MSVSAAAVPIVSKTANSSDMTCFIAFSRVGLIRFDDAGLPPGEPQILNEMARIAVIM